MANQLKLAATYQPSCSHNVSEHPTIVLVTLASQQLYSNHRQICQSYLANHTYYRICQSHLASILSYSYYISYYYHHQMNC